jgi:hypothetical protein
MQQASSRQLPTRFFYAQLPQVLNLWQFFCFELFKPYKKFYLFWALNWKLRISFFAAKKRGLREMILIF